MKTFEDYSIEELERFKAFYIIIMIVIAIIAFITTWAFLLIDLFLLIPIGNCNRCINEKRRFEEYCSKIPDIKKQETKAILARRPDCNPNSKQYQDWATEYEESKLDKNIRYPEKHEDVFYQFELEKLVYRYSAESNKHNGSDIYYFKSSEYKQKAADYLLRINLTLNNFHKKYGFNPAPLYDPALLSFEHAITYPGVVCKVFHHPLTTTNKLAKYPYSLLLAFGTSSNSSVSIFFDKLGNIAKGNLVYWHNKECYLFDVAVHNKEFQIIRAYRNDLGKKVKLFDIKEQQ